MAVIRYPGSKAKLAPRIMQWFPEDMHGRLFSSGVIYCEPFFGSGAIGWLAMPSLADGARVVINDKDYWVYCLWRAVRDKPKLLAEKIVSAQLSSALFEEYKATDGDRTIDPVECGFRKLLLHQMSFSGLGAMAGGPIGGAEQKNEKYNIYARWNVATQVASIAERNQTMRRLKVEIECRDFEDILRKHDSENTFFYLDPPYFEKGGSLYKYAFSDQDHNRLAACLRDIRGRFLLSYDDAPEVRALYDWCESIELCATYSICTARKNKELLFKNYP